MDKQRFIRQKPRERRVRWSTHGLKELASETLSVKDVEVALEQAKVIENYPHLRRFLPDCLVLAFDALGQPIHVVVALSESHDYVLIVTVYRPSVEEWEDDWRTRR
jgi:hypothetical protein